ncbi:MAG: class I SAM-dependent methyltransferase, partial [Hyphomicrobiales bacterium]|nr:class I SAM-dependent methyltransferase [Hyphomicrobiales bacterium]
MSSSIPSAHDRAISDQFTRQAEGFAQSRALHAQDVVDFVVDAVAPKPADRAIDLACGPGSVACALAARAARVVGVDATQAMLDEAAKLSAQRGLRNVEWAPSSVYRTPFADASFDVVTCRFAF